MPNMMEHYYLANKIWVYGNAVMIVPFITACLNRFFRPDMSKKLWTDYLTRIMLTFTVAFYIYEMWVKYKVDGGESICQKGFFIHHFSSTFILIPMIVNEYMPWFANPIGFLHGFCIFFPEFEMLNYVYASSMMYFHFKIYQSPYRNLKYYWIIRFAINGVWVFCLMLLVGDCSNYLPLSPD